MALWRDHGYDGTFKIEYDAYPGNAVAGVTEPGDVEGMDQGDGASGPAYSGGFGEHVLMDAKGPAPAGQPAACEDYDERPDPPTCSGLPVGGGTGGGGDTGDPATGDGTYDPQWDKLQAQTLCNAGLTSCAGLIPQKLAPLQNLTGMASDLSDVSDKLDTLDELHTDLAQLHDDLTSDGVKLAAGTVDDPLVVDQATSDGGTTSTSELGSDDAHPQYVRLASSDTTGTMLGDGFNAQRQALWFMVGLTCSCFFGYFFYRQIAMRG